MSRADSPDARARLGHVYLHHYASLVRLAAFLSHDSGTAEDIAQEAYVRASLRRRNYSQDDDGLSYLRTCVVNLCHSQWRRRQVAQRAFPQIAVEQRTTLQGDYAMFDRQVLVQALRELSPRQREAVVLRHYVGLSERETAETLGITLGAVKTHASRGLRSLRTHMEQKHDQ